MPAGVKEAVENRAASSTTAGVSGGIRRTTAGGAATVAARGAGVAAGGLSSGAEVATGGGATTAGDRVADTEERSARRGTATRAADRIGFDGSTAGASAEEAGGGAAAAAGAGAGAGAVAAGVATAVRERLASDAMYCQSASSR